jgi:hypothetical protein
VTACEQNIIGRQNEKEIAAFQHSKSKANNSTHICLPIARQRQRPSTIDCVKTILFRQFIL